MKWFTALMCILVGCEVVEESRMVVCTAGGDRVIITYDNIKPSEAKAQMIRITRGIKELEGTVICH